MSRVLLGGLYSKDFNLLGTMLGPLIFGNPDLREEATMDAGNSVPPSTHPPGSVLLH